MPPVLMDTQGIHEQAHLVYLQWQDLYNEEKPFQVFANIPEGSTERLTNLVFGAGPLIKINDLRGNEDNFTLDGNGFKVIQDKLPDDFNLKSRECMGTEVVPYLEDLIRRNVEGADFVRCMDWGFRRNVEMSQSRMDVNDNMQILNPGRQVHCDQSPKGALGRLHQHAPEMAELAKRGRLRIINLWRPLNHPVKDNSLTLCDGSTIKASDLVEADHISRTYIGNTMYGLFSPNHKWYYLHHQTPEEVFLFKIFDSDPDVAAKCSLHAAFDYSNVSDDSIPRESMEVRFLVVTLPTKDT
ncbi:hypothetical protein F4802DRAFT_554752 [Xylaria palmicola]|nr:hypothetical protein F4802DRAFT_554752 [Xylaria palmicola]